MENFVSEKDLEKHKEERQKEWERVRKNDDPIERPEEPSDNRCLYDRLKEQTDRKQSEYEEAHKLKNMVRGLDDEEIGFLDFVDNMKLKEEKLREAEERSLLSELKNSTVATPVEILSEIKAPSLPSSTGGSVHSKKLPKQKELIAGAIVKRKSAELGPQTDNQTDIPAAKRPREAVSCNGSGNTGATVLNSVRPSAVLCIGKRPSLVCYDSNGGEGNSSDSDGSSTSSSDPELLLTTPVNATLSAAANDSKNEGGCGGQDKNKKS